MNAHLTNNPQLKIGETVLKFRRKKNRVTVVFNSNNSNLVGINMLEYAKYNTESFKYSEALKIYKILPKDIKEPVAPEKTTIKGYAYCDPADEFDMIFGMRKAIFNAFDNYKFTKEFRKLIIETFDSTYGRGICNPKQNQKRIYTEFNVPITKALSLPITNIKQTISDRGIGSLIFLGTENAQDVERWREMKRTLKEEGTKQNQLKELNYHLTKFNDIKNHYPNTPIEVLLLDYPNTIIPDTALYNSVKDIINYIKYNSHAKNALNNIEKENNSQNDLSVKYELGHKSEIK